MRTIGGGIVVDPFAPAARRNTAARQNVVMALAADSAQQALANLSTASPDGVDLRAFEAAFNLDEEFAAALYKRMGMVVLARGAERIAVSTARHDEIAQAILAQIATLHREDPRSLGLEMGSLRERLRVELPDWALAQIVRELAAKGKVQLAGTRVRQPGHDATSNPEDEKLWLRILPVLQKDDPLPPNLREIAEQLRLPEKAVSDLLHRKSRSGEPIKVMADRFLLRSSILRLAKTAEETAAQKPNSQFTAADYRDRCGASRKLSIDVLEYFDRIGFTQRIGDARRIRRPIEQALAQAAGPSVRPK
jgi:selenocysteine-specific elongation factor